MAHPPPGLPTLGAAPLRAVGSELKIAAQPNPVRQRPSSVSASPRRQDPAARGRAGARDGPNELGPRLPWPRRPEHWGVHMTASLESPADGVKKMAGRGSPRVPRYQPARSQDIGPSEPGRHS